MVYNCEYCCFANYNKAKFSQHCRTFKHIVNLDKKVKVSSELMRTKIDKSIEKEINKPKFHCSVCDKNINTFYANKHAETSYHKKRLGLITIPLP